MTYGSMSSVSSSDADAMRSFIDQLSQSAERLAYALSASETGLWDLHVPTQRLLSSPHWARMLGLPAHGGPRSFTEWLSMVHPDDQAMFDFLIEAYLDGRVESFEVEHRLRGRSEWRWVSARGAVI